MGEYQGDVPVSPQYRASQLMSMQETHSVSLLSLCARQGAFTKEWKTPMTPAGGIISWTARVSIVRWDLKEAADKTLA